MLRLLQELNKGSTDALGPGCFRLVQGLAFRLVRPSHFLLPARDIFSVIKYATAFGPDIERIEVCAYSINAFLYLSHICSLILRVLLAAQCHAVPRVGSRGSRGKCHPTENCRLVPRQNSLFQYIS